MRRIKIKRNVLGEVYNFFITLNRNTFRCTYTIHFKDAESSTAFITEDFEYIVLDKPIELDGYINGINPPKRIVNKIRIPKDQKHKFKEEINGI